MRPCAQEGSRRRAGCRVLRLRGSPCPMRAAQLLLLQHLLRPPLTLLLQHLPQVLTNGLCTALFLRLLQDTLGDVRPRLLPAPRMRLPGVGLPGLGLLGLGLLGRPSRHASSMIHQLRQLLIAVEAGHGAESIQRCMRSRVPHPGPCTLWTLRSIPAKILIQLTNCQETGVLCPGNAAVENRAPSVRLCHEYPSQILITYSHEGGTPEGLMAMAWALRPGAAVAAAGPGHRPPGRLSPLRRRTAAAPMSSGRSAVPCKPQHTQSVLNPAAFGDVPTQFPAHIWP